jgi:hypothetical protein
VGLAFASMMVYICYSTLAGQYNKTVGTMT